MIQEHVNMTKTEKKVFSLAKKLTLLTDQQMLANVANLSTKSSRQEFVNLCVDNKIQDVCGDGIVPEFKKKKRCLNFNQQKLQKILNNNKEM